MKITVLIAFLVLSLIECFGQEKNDSNKYDYNVLYPKVYSPQGNTSIINPFTQLNLTSDFENQSASATLGAKWGMSAMSVYIKQPFKEKPKKATPLSLDGLENGTSFEFAYQFTHWKPKEDLAVFESYRKIYMEKRNIKADSAKYITFMDLDAASKKELEDMNAINWKKPVLFGLSYSAGKTSYNYITDSTSINPLKLTGVNQNLRITLGTILKSSQVLALSYIMQYKYSSGDPVDYIFPVGTNGAAYTKEVVIGKPERKQESRIALEYRCTFFNKQNKPGLALNPSISYLVNQELLSIAIPIYFLNYTADKKSKGLQGGIALGYLSEIGPWASFDEGFTAALFIAEPFDLYGLFKTR
jgi:hypothetical protein